MHIHKNTHKMKEMHVDERKLGVGGGKATVLDNPWWKTIASVVKRGDEKRKFIPI